MLFEQLALPFLLKQHTIHIIHSLHYTFPLFAPCSRAVTIHDLTFFLFPELHTRGRRLLFPFFIRRAMRAAECPIFVSRSTQQDAEHLLGSSRHPGHVVPLGVSLPRPMTAAELTSFLQPLGIAQPYLLFLGTVEPRKNVVRLIQAFEAVAQNHPELSLVIAGKLGWHCEPVMAALASSPVSSRIRHLGFVTEDQKQALLSSCATLVYPSLYEGFGLPVLEAMVHGAPVITSSVSSMPEVAGSAALLVDPLSLSGLSDAMESIFANVRVSAELQRNGLRRAAEFSWRKNAETTYQAYQSIAG